MTADKSKTPVKKTKLIRDSFTIPKTEYASIETLKNRAVALGTSVKKGELLRAGLMALEALNDGAYKRALAAVPALKTGRPAAEAEPVSVPVSSPARPAAKKLAEKAATAQPVTQKTAVRRPKATSAAPAGPAAALRKVSVSPVAGKAPAKSRSRATAARGSARSATPSA